MCMYTSVFCMLLWPKISLTCHGSLVLCCSVVTFQCLSVWKARVVLLFFHKSTNRPPTKTNESFIIIPITYTNGTNGNSVNLSDEAS